MYDIRYSAENAENDKKALKDIRGFLSPNQWDALQQGVGMVIGGSMKFANFNNLFALAGVRGYPFHAFCREYLLKEYREWMASGDDAVETDEYGFALPEKKE